ncbi:hypothetical protein TEA_007541 [Camellia sinensis var. sinensis]|uniref:CRAL-TRIO domain-containing protein n=1 Tax=Camellia sinensis var. sinensis TaxID=542762 RepID=A0A4S4D6G6_CAMSN|nr:hypothetical protein TEA_007541 [Camellia sinensis var. sinensis]
MYRPVAATTTRGGLPTDSGDSVVTLDQVPRWSDAEYRFSYENEDHAFPNSYFPDPLTSSSGAETSGNGMVPRFPVDHEINSKIYLWRGYPWNLEVDAVVNSTNENLDEAHSSPGLHAAAGPGLAEDCATLFECFFFQSLSSKLSLFLGTVRRFLEKQKHKIKAVVFCTTTSSDTEIYKRLLPLYFPRDKLEEEVAMAKLPADVGDENGETAIDERKIRIKPLPDVKKTVSKPLQASMDLPVSDVGLTRRPLRVGVAHFFATLSVAWISLMLNTLVVQRIAIWRRLWYWNSSYLDSYIDPAFMSLIKDPDQRRKEQWEKTAQARSGWNCAKILGYGDLGGPPLSAAEEYSLHSRYLAKANSVNLSEIAEMKIVYRGGVDSDGRPVMVVVGAHFLLRCLDLERFVLYVVKEFEPLIQKPYTIVYFHSAASLQMQPDLGWMRRLQQILGRKHQRNLHAIYVLHPTFGLKAAILALQMFVDSVVWKKVVYVDRLLQLFRYVPREQLTIPDFVHDLEVNGGKGVIVDPRTKYVYHRP